MISRSSIIESIKSFMNIVLLLFVVYFIIIIIHLAWYIASPDGFWGFNYFIEVTRVLLFCILLLVVIVVIVLLILNYLYSLFKGKFNLKKLLNGIGVLLFIIFAVVINGVYYNYGSFWFTSKMSDKYSYLEQSEKMLKKGEFVNAIEFSENAYEKYRNTSYPSVFFILSHLYSKTTIDKNVKLDKKYASIINLAMCIESTMQDLGQAEKKYKEALSLIGSESYFENQDEYLVFPKMALANIRELQGDYEASEKLFFEVEKLYSGLSDKDLSYKIQSLTIFLVSSMRSRDLEESELILNSILKSYENSELKKDKNYQFLINTKVGIEIKMNKYNAARKTYAELISLDISEDPNIFAILLSTKANFFIYAYSRGLNYKDLKALNLIKSSSFFFDNDDKNLLDEAERLLIEQVEILREYKGENSVSFCEALIELGDFYKHNGFLNKAKKVFKNLHGLIEYEKQELRDVYLKVLLAHISLGDEVDLIMVKEAEQLIFERLNLKLFFSTSRAKETYVSKVENEINIINGYYLKNNSPQSNISLYNNILRFNKTALNANKEVNELINELPNEIKKAYTELLNSSINFNDSISINVNEKEFLYSIIEDYNLPFYYNQDSNYLLIQNCLDKDEYAIEILTTDYLKKNGEFSKKYFALVLNNELEWPVRIELFNQNELEEILDIQGDIVLRNNLLYKTKDENVGLRGLIWNPLKDFIKPGSKIFLSLSGDLSSIALPSLFISSKNDIRLVSSTKNIIELHEGYYDDSKRNIAFGGVDFSSINLSNRTRSFSSVTNSIKNNLQNGFFPPLPYTVKEVNEIKTVLAANQQECLVLYDDEASEINLRKLNGIAFNFIHIATHGFYYTSADVNLMDKNVTNISIDDSMNRSGILLSQNLKNNLSYTNDGIVTAKELSSMDLSNVDLMVLSACDTGKGDYKGSEGVFGLQRALELSGVKKQIVSLWKVPDKETSELFTLFYKNYMEGNSIYQSLKQAQISMSETYEPYYWASFILLE
jgi:hypothetical protein